MSPSHKCSLGNMSQLPLHRESKRLGPRSVLGRTALTGACGCADYALSLQKAGVASKHGAAAAAPTCLKAQKSYGC